MLSQLTRCAQNLWARLSSAAGQLLRRLTEPARPNLVTGTLADLPRSRAELLAENALLRQQLIVLCRNMKTPRLTWRERWSLVFPTPAGFRVGNKSCRSSSQTHCYAGTERAFGCSGS